MSSLKLLHSGGNGVTISAPSSNPASNRTITVPGNADGEMLTTTNPKTGNIIQVVQAVKTDTASQAGAIATALNFDSLFSQAITPSSSSNKIEVNFNLSVSLSAAPNQIFFRLRRKIGSGSFADITDIMGNTAGSRYRCMHSAINSDNLYMMPTINLNFLDSPNTTDAVTYSFSAAHDSGSTRTIFINREGGSYNDTYVPRGASSIILREVAG